jgi:Ser/Thr protein kinase RdoA (MazF antagonist)
LYDPQQGSIAIDGVNIKHYQRDSLRRAISIVPQNSGLFGTSIKENIAYSKLDATMEEIVAAAVGHAARTLAVFHQEDLATTRRHSCEDEIADLKRAGALLQWACPRLRAEVEGIVSAVAQGLEDVPPGPTHRDLKPAHILLDGDRLALIDLDWFTGADPVLDPAALLATIASMPFRFPTPHDRVRTATRAFAEAYFVRVPRAWRRRFPLHYAGAALREAVGFFRRQEPGWPGTVAALVEEAGDSLAGSIW